MPKTFIKDKICDKMHQVSQVIIIESDIYVMWGKCQKLCNWPHDMPYMCSFLRNRLHLNPNGRWFYDFGWETGDAAGKSPGFKSQKRRYIL